MICSIIQSWLFSLFKQNDASPPFNDMPSFMSENIMKRLPLSDLIRFGAVCKEWRRLQIEHRLHGSPTLDLPWFIPLIRLSIFNKDDDSVTCISPFEQKTYSLRHSPRLASNLGSCDRTLGSCSGWIVLRRWNNVLLVNPMSDEIIKLPCIPDTDRIRRYDLHRYWIHSSGSSFWVLSPPPFQVISLINTRASWILLVRRDVDKEWTKLNYSHLSTSPPLAIVAAAATFLTGELYFLYESWDLLVVSCYPMPTTRMLRMDKTQMKEDINLSKFCPHLVESNGDILLVLKSPSSLCHPILYSPVDFLVFKANIEQNMWVKMESLGDRVLVIHGHNSASFSAPDHVGDGVRLRGNCIYYYSSREWVFWAFDFKSKVVIDANYRLFHSQNYQMFMPSIC